MCTNASNSTLVTADVKGYKYKLVLCVYLTCGSVLGFVTLWNIKNYCMDGRSPKNPPKSTMLLNA